MAPRCPFCDRRIRIKDVDFERDSVPCRACGKVVAFSSLPGVADNPALQRLMQRLGVGTGTLPGDVGALHDAAADVAAEPARPAPRPGSRRSRATASGVDIAQPPPGAWYRDDGVTLEVGAHTRSIGMAIFMTLISGFWCSITGVFAAFALGSVLAGLGIIASSSSGGAGGVAFGLFMLLFCTPFILIGLWMFWTALMSFAGREVVLIREDTLSHFTGIGPLGFRKRLSASAVRQVEEDVRISKTKNGTTTTKTIALYADAPKPHKFGAMLSEPRRQFMLAALSQVLTPDR